MKLVEILAREMEKWPDSGTDVVGQSADGSLHLNASTAKNRGFTEKVYELAEDWCSQDVTRADWKAERAKLKAPKANGGGWIRHRGRKMPVQSGTLVDLKLRGGVIHRGKFCDNHAWIHTGKPFDVMYYRLSEPSEQTGKQPSPKLERALKQAEEIRITAQSADTMLAIRDRIRELDAQRSEVESTYQRQISEITQERESLVQKLAGEGLALVEVVVQPVDFDPSDKSTWRAGCSVEIESSDNPSWTIRKSVVGVLKFDEEMYHQGWYIDYASNGHWCISDNTQIKFVSRPAS